MTQLSSETRRLSQQVERIPVRRHSQFADPQREKLLCGHTCWMVESGLREAFFDASGLRLQEWLNSGQAEIIKTGPHRTVYRLNLPAGRFYLKHYRIPDWQAQFQNLFRPCKAELEWNTAQRLTELGINTFEPIALGKTKGFGLVKDSFLISREIENVQTAQEFVQEKLRMMPIPRQTVLRQQLAVELGRLTACLHQHGMIHRDYHAGNFLIHIESNNTLKLWLIDLHAVSHRRKLTPRSMERNLTLLNHFFSHYSTKSDRFRFFRAYWRTLCNAKDSPGSQPHVSVTHSIQIIARRIESYCERAGRRAFRKGDRKWIRGNRRLIIADTQTDQCRGIASVGHPSLVEIRENPEILFSAGTVLCRHQHSQHTRIADVKVEVNGNTLQGMASAKDVPLGDPRVFRFRRWSEVRRAWEMGHALRRRNIKTPLPILFVEKPSDGKMTQYLLTEAVPDALPLTHWFHETATGDTQNSNAETESVQKRLIKTLADQIRKLHRHGFDHRELSAGNILVSRISRGIEPDSEKLSEFEIWLTEPGNIYLRKHLTGKQIVSNLARLNGSLPQGVDARMTHRVRFMKRYLRNNFDGEWKHLWQSIANESRQVSP